MNISTNLILTSLLAGTSFGASAQQLEATSAITASKPESSEAMIPDVLITAERRTSGLRETSLAVTAVTSADLARDGITNIQTLASIVPGLSFGQGPVPNVSIRGIGLSTQSVGQDPDVAINLDGVYLSRPTNSLSPLYDLDRVEVVRGPQGTLYGRNATGGSINLITSKPTATLQGYATVEAGEYGRLLGTTAISGPLGEHLRARIAAHGIRRDGYAEDAATRADLVNERYYAARGIVEADVGETTLLRLTVDHFHEHDRAYQASSLGSAILRNISGLPAAAATGTGSPFSSNYSVGPLNELKVSGITFDIDSQIGSVSLLSKSAYRRSSTHYWLDGDGGSLPILDIFRDENSRQLSQEFQFGGSHGSLDWLLGLYYFNERIHAQIDAPMSFNLPQPVSVYTARGTIHTQALAAFTNARLALSDQITLVGGLRYSRERKRLDDFGYAAGLLAPVTGLYHKSWGALTPRAAIEYKPRSDLFFYFAVSRGFKSGGYDIGSFSTTPSYDPETIWNYEAGAKLELLDGRLLANITAYHFNYGNLQVGLVDDDGLHIENAAKAKAHGLEAELTWRPIRAVTLAAKTTYLDSHFSSYITNDGLNGIVNADLSGNQLSLEPKFGAVLEANYSLVLASGAVLTFGGNMQWYAKRYFSAFNHARIEMQPSYIRCDLHAGFTPANGRWTIGVYARNLGDRGVLSSSVAITNASSSDEYGYFLPPRQVGVSFTTSF